MKRFQLFLVTFLVLVFGFIFSGCAQKTQIKAIKAGMISDSAIKDIAVLPFENDEVSQSIQINDALSNVNFKGEKYFNVQDRVNLEKIMVEKKLNDSGLVDIIHKDKNIGLGQIRTIVSGVVSVDDVANSKFLENRTDYDTCRVTLRDKNGNPYCTQYRIYNVICEQNVYTLTSNVQFTRVDDGKIVFTKVFTKKSMLKHCVDDSSVLLSKKDVNTKHAKEIAEDLAKLVAPSYVDYVVQLFDDEDIKYTSEQSKRLKLALELIKNQRHETANDILDNLNSELKELSITTLYNFAVTSEILGDLSKAYKLYQKADSVALQNGKVLEDISLGLKRVKNSIEELEKANKQFLNLNSKGKM